MAYIREAFSHHPKLRGFTALWLAVAGQSCGMSIWLPHCQLAWHCGQLRAACSSSSDPAHTCYQSLYLRQISQFLVSMSACVSQDYAADMPAAVLEHMERIYGKLDAVHDSLDGIHADSIAVKPEADGTVRSVQSELDSIKDQLEAIRSASDSRAAAEQPDTEQAVQEVRPNFNAATDVL